MPDEYVSTVSASLRNRVCLGADALENSQACRLLGYIDSCRVNDGGFRGRGSRSDLYYTIFGLDCALALNPDLDIYPVVGYLREQGCKGGHDLVHLACLARGLARTREWAEPGLVTQTFQAIEAHRREQGGYYLNSEQARESVYASFLAYLAYDEWRLVPPAVEKLVPLLDSRRTNDGAYSDQPGSIEGTTTVTAAATVLRLAITGDIDGQACDWLVCRQHAMGGFAASPRTPIPDLLSTATALFAFYVMNGSGPRFSAETLQFVEDMWVSTGGFAGTLLDVQPDCEYSYYGLLALGLLSGGEHDGF